MQHLNWDNLRYVLMVANRGSISAAARELGVDRSTVLRRINSFQDRLNCRIFERGAGGYVLTPEAEKMIDAAREVESTLFYLQRQIEGRELRLEGELRVTTTDSTMLSVLGPHLASFQRRFPHIVIEVLVTNSILDIHRRDADIAIRPTPDPDDRLFSRRLCDVEFGLYGHPDQIARIASRSPLEAQRWIGFADVLAATPVNRWLDQHVEPDRVCMRCDSFVAVYAAAEASIGIAVMPTFLGDASTVLRRLDYSLPEISAGLWLLTHPDLVRAARVNAFIEHFSEALAPAESGSPRSLSGSSPAPRSGPSSPAPTAARRRTKKPRPGSGS